MDKVAAIRHAVVVEKRSRRSVAKAFRVGRKTIDRYVDDGVTVGQRKPSPRPSPKTAAAQKKLDELLADVKEVKKHRLTAKRAQELLLGAGVDVGYTLVKGLMAERRRAAKAVSVPLEYAPGEVAEVDFFEVVVVVDGVEQTAWLFVMRLMSSGRDFCRVYPRQDQVCFLDGHVRAFAYFGGVPGIRSGNCVGTPAGMLRHPWHREARPVAPNRAPGGAAESPAARGSSPSSSAPARGRAPGSRPGAA